MGRQDKIDGAVVAGEGAKGNRLHVALRLGQRGHKILLPRSLTKAAFLANRLVACRLAILRQRLFLAAELADENSTVGRVVHTAVTAMTAENIGRCIYRLIRHRLFQLVRVYDIFRAQSSFQ